MRRRLTTGLLVWAAWSALAIFFAISTALTYVSQGRPPLWWFNFATAFAQWWIWALLTPLVLWMGRRWPLARGRLLRGVSLHLALSIVVAVVKVAIEGRVRVWLFNIAPYVLISNLALQVLIYWALVAAAHALDGYSQARTRAAEMEASLDQARLQILRAQLRPHFLFNALNTIAEMIHEDPDRADRMVGRLSDLLRASLDAGDRSDATLDAELTLVRHYLAIQEARFGDRLTTTIAVEPECSGVSVPSLLLQPIVENAVVHGVAPRASGGRVSVAARRRGGMLEIVVEDDGGGMAGPAREGIGLSSTRARVAALHDPAAAFTLAARSGGGTVATITLPWRRGAGVPS